VVPEVVEGMDFGTAMEQPTAGLAGGASVGRGVGAGAGGQFDGGVELNVQICWFIQESPPLTSA